MDGFWAADAPWWTLLSVSAGALIGAGVSVWSERSRAARAAKDADRELMREVLRATIRYRRAVQQAFLSTHKDATELAQRLREVAEAGHHLLGAVVEAEAFGPIGVGTLAGLAFEETQKVEAAARTGDPETINAVTLKVHERTLYLVDGIREKLGLPARTRRTRWWERWRAQPDGLAPGGVTPPQTP